jgi:hypothetical protein
LIKEKKIVTKNDESYNTASFLITFTATSGMIAILSNSYFQLFVIPLLTTLLTVFVKIVSRNDRYYTLVKEDFSIGLELAVTSILLLATDSLKYISKFTDLLNKNSITHNDKLLVVPWILLMLFIGAWGMSTLVRKFGWKSASEMTWGWGIIIPNLFGLLSLIFAVNWING